MSSPIDSIDDDVCANGICAIQDPSRVLLDDCADADLIRKTQRVAQANVTPDVPSPHDRLRPGKAAPVEATSEQLETLNRLATQAADLKNQLEDVEEKLTGPNPPAPHEAGFPNVAFEALMAGLIKESTTNTQLQGHIAKVKETQKDIDLLLDLSAALTASKNDQKMSEEVKRLLGELKSRGIDLWKGEVLDKEKISELKSLTSAQVDKLRSNLQIVFTTKIQTLIQQIGAILESIKDIIRQNSRVISTANRLPGH